MSRLILIGSWMVDLASLAGTDSRSLSTPTLILTVLGGSLCLLTTAWALAEGLFTYLTEPSDPLVERAEVNDPLRVYE